MTGEGVGQAPFDPGLQLERTALSWRRTALALTIGPLLAARVLAPELGVLSVLAAVGGVALGGYVALASSARYRRIHRWLTGEQELRTMPGAALLLVLASVPPAGLAVAVVVLAVSR